MKKLAFAIGFLVVASIALFTGCAKQTPEDPCSGKGTISFENKLDSTMSIRIVQTRDTATVRKDFIRSFTLTANQPYTFKIEGLGFQMDSTLMILPCDNRLMVILPR